MGVESGGGVVVQPITLQLYRLRDREVILDRDLAACYGISTKRLNFYVKRHNERFPEDFAFQVTRSEWVWLRDTIPTRIGRGGQGYRPRVFTEQGVMMVASIMRGRRATATSVEILRAFVRGRPERIVTIEWSDELFVEMGRLVAGALAAVHDDREVLTYFIQAGDQGPIKIGITSDFEKRFRSLEMTCPVPLRLLGIVTDNIEAMSHTTLKRWRLHGEWFEPAPEVLAFIRNLLPTRTGVN